MKGLSLGLLCVCVCLSGCGDRRPTLPPPSGATRVQVTTCSRRDVTRHVELPADVLPRVQVQLYARVSGYLEAVLVDRGDHVRAGQLLASIRLPEAERDVAQSRASYSKGQAELVAAQARLPRAQAEQQVTTSDYRRALAQRQQLESELHRSLAQEQQAQAELQLAQANSKRLFAMSKEDAGLVATQDLDVSRTSVQVARERLHSAEGTTAAARQSLLAGRAGVAAASSRIEAGASQMRIVRAQLSSSTFQGEADLQAARKTADLLTYSQIRAPFAGTITSRHLDPGALIQAADRSAQTSTRPLFNLADFETVRVRVELPQRVAVVVHRGTPVEVHLDGVANRVFQAKVSRTSGTLDPSSRTMVAEIDVPNPRHLLRPGMYVKVRLTVASSKNTLALPVAAVVGARDQRVVYLVVGKEARRVAIKTGIENAQWVEITEGLKGGETVILSPPDTLTSGQPVEVSSASPHP